MAELNSSFQRFCGGQIWDTELTWGRHRPQFTLCFQWTALIWVPCAFLWLILIPYVYYLSGLKHVETKCNRLNIFKTVFSCLLSLVSICDIVKGAVDVDNGSRSTVYVVSPVILFASFIVATVLIQCERKRGLCTSGVLFMFYLLLVIAGIIPFYMKIIDPVGQGAEYDLFQFVTFFVYYGILLVQLVLFCFAEKVPQEIHIPGKEPCPKLSSSFLSRITFSWVTGLTYRGYKKPIEEKDMFAPCPNYMTKNIYPDFNKAWKKELHRGMKAKYQTDSNKTYDNKMMVSSKSGSIDTEKTPLLQSQISHGIELPGTKSPQKKTGAWSLCKVLFKVFGWSIFKSHLCKLVVDLLTFVGPLLQSCLITFAQDPFMAQWKGYLYAVGFLVVTIVNSFFFNQTFYISMTTGMQMRSAVTSAIYKKALTMSNESKRSTTVGEIVNLMSIDAQRLQDSIRNLWVLWSSPFQIGLAMYFLWGILGPSAFSGLALMVILVPINIMLAAQSRKFQIAQMKQKDVRMKIMNEILSAIKVLKLYAWELSFKKKVETIRHVELNILMKAAYIRSIGAFTLTCAPFLVTLVCFTTFTLTGGILDAKTAFVSLTLFNILRMPLSIFPQAITQLTVAAVSVERLARFLQLPDMDCHYVRHHPKSEHPMSISNGTFSWGDKAYNSVTLNNINVTVEDSSLVAVVGQVGCGKSSLISAFLGEMEYVSGSVNVRGSIAYVAQEAWIQNKTLRDNVLFGHEMEQAKYDEVIEACALKPDLEVLPSGDLTLIGENGINLSGGQKQRVSLARAVYSNADIYLLDDPLSAVDSRVGKHIFEKVIIGLLKNKTRVLVTHGVQWLPSVDKIVVIKAGHVTETGSYQQLMSHDGDFAQFLKTYLVEEDDNQEDEEVKEEKGRMLRQVSGIVEDDKQSQKLSEKGSQGSSEKLRKRKSMMSNPKTESKKSEKGQKETEVKGGGNIEKAEMGQVKMSVFYTYMTAIGMIISVNWILLNMFVQVASISSSIWLSIWSVDPLILNSTLIHTPEYKQQTDMYLEVYGAFGAAQALFVFTLVIVTAVGSIRAARKLHVGMLDHILRAPMWFFDITPTGRIINRFAQDIATVDNTIADQLKFWMTQCMIVLSTFVVVSYATPIFIAVIVPIFIVYYFLQGFYIQSTRQLKRIESITKSPIFVHFGETITGASTIRAFNIQNEFMDHSDNAVDHNLTFFYGGIIINRWLGVRLDILGSLVMFSAALLAVIGRNSLSAGVVGLSITYALQFSRALGFLIRQTNAVQVNTVAVERIKEYTEIAVEADWYVDKGAPHPTWPDEGKVALKGFSTRYRMGMDVVLNEITADIKGQEKIGVVGRTGAGKSSLALALFRLLEASAGSIIIDGLHVGTLGLHQLRSKLTILPQDPVLFSGTLRFNLDPFDQYTDEQIWTALEHAHIKKFISSLNSGLEYECIQGGLNLSVGQRQLLCLARTLLRKTKILILDEATAAVDLETDEVIQATIRTEFADCTVITIAHRLNTIMDSDRVMVLENGKIIEFDTPYSLMNDKNSTFFSMAKDAGITSL